MRAAGPHVLLAIDASVLVAEALRQRGRKLLAHPDLDLVIAEEAWRETLHELPRRAGVLIAGEKLEQAAAAEFLDAATAVVLAYVTVASSELYADRIDEARRRIPRDPRDAPTVALALALDCGIWTADRDFFGCGLPVWTTETLVSQIGGQPGL